MLRSITPLIFAGEEFPVGSLQDEVPADENADLQEQLLQDDDEIADLQGEKDDEDMTIFEALYSEGGKLVSGKIKLSGQEPRVLNLTEYKEMAKRSGLPINDSEELPSIGEESSTTRTTQQKPLNLEFGHLKSKVQRSNSESQDECK